MEINAKQLLRVLRKRVVLRKHNARAISFRPCTAVSPFSVSFLVPYLCRGTDQSAYRDTSERASERAINKTRHVQIRDVEDRGRIDQRIPQGDRVVEEQEEEQEGQEPAGRYRVDLEGTGGPRQVLHRPHRAEPAQAGRGSERFSRGVLPVPDEVHGGPTIAA